MLEPICGKLFISSSIFPSTLISCAVFLFEPLPSAYKARHSCETALIHVQNNILRAMDQGKMGILHLLDMSAAFETVDHITLLDKLHTELGIGCTALDWFESYLVDRHQVVATGGEHSDSCLL